jgi:FemAB family protein
MGEAVQAAVPIDIRACAPAAKMQTVLRQEDPALWDRLLATLEYTPVAYASHWIDYQLAYHRGNAGQWWDTSLILFHDKRPCGVWPMSYSIGANGASITSQGAPLLPPLFSPSLPAGPRKALTQECIDLWHALCAAAEISSAEAVDGFCGQSLAGLGEWYDWNLRRGARPQLRHELFVDLSLTMEAIKASFRKSYRPLIGVGLRTWQVEVLCSADQERWNEYRDLHVKVAGRVTRSQQSWDSQLEAIANGHAFLVLLRDGQGVMVGGGFFNISRDEAAYGVGAYDRSLFDKPLGHVVQYRAIEVMKERGLRWYRIGFRPYPSDLPAPTPKDLSIGEFKQGFATHLFPQYVLSHDLKSSSR